MSYTLIVPALSPDTPFWLKGIIANQQAQIDARYLDALKQYDAGGVDWINANIVNRAGSPDPASFVPAPYAAPIPEREILDGVPTGATTSTKHIDMVIPQVHPPTLPAYVAPGAPGKLGTGAAAQDASYSAAFAAIINLLLEIKAKL